MWELKIRLPTECLESRPLKPVHPAMHVKSGRPIVGIGPAQTEPRSLCIHRKSDSPHPGRECGSLSDLLARWQKRVCTMCTLWASEWVVLVPDSVGLPMYSGELSVCKGWSPVRVPPRHSVTPRQRGFCFNVWTLSLVGSL